MPRGLAARDERNATMNTECSLAGQRTYCNFTKTGMCRMAGADEGGVACLPAALRDGRKSLLP
jgi:hypothetical protein